MKTWKRCRCQSPTLRPHRQTRHRRHGLLDQQCGQWKVYFLGPWLRRGAPGEWMIRAGPARRSTRSRRRQHRLSAPRTCRFVRVHGSFQTRRCHCGPRCRGPRPRLTRVRAAAARQGGISWSGTKLLQFQLLMSDLARMAGSGPMRLKIIRIVMEQREICTRAATWTSPEQKRLSPRVAALATLLLCEKRYSARAVLMRGPTKLSIVLVGSRWVLWM